MEGISKGDRRHVETELRCSATVSRADCLSGSVQRKPGQPAAARRASQDPTSAGCSAGSETDPAQSLAPPEPAEKVQPKEPTPDKVTPKPKPAGPHPALLNPSLAKEKAPAQFRVKFETTKGAFVAQVTRASAPLGVDRFYNLVKMGYYNEVAFFRVIDGFMAQFGIHGDPKVNEKWESARINDDPTRESNVRGAITFATGRSQHAHDTTLHQLRRQ